MNLDGYINSLYESQNIGALDIQKNLYKKEDYIRLFKNVLEVLKNNKDSNIKELRDKLYEKSMLDKLLRDFFLNKKMAPGAVISYGTKNFEERITLGNRQEVIMKDNDLVEDKEEMSEDTIFDLASTTKLFTSLAILKLVELNELNLNDDVTKYAPEFSNLKGLTILDLLTFHPLETPERLDRLASKEDAKEVLLKATKKDIGTGLGIYNDIGPMIIKYIVENITGLKYKDFIQIEILNKTGMNNTFVNIPESELRRVANHNYDGRIYSDGNYIIRDKAIKGVSTDDKARIFGQSEGILSGHAGLFSTSGDMTKLLRALIDNKIINFNLRDMMAKNRRGYIYTKPDGTKGYTQTYGMLVYSKNPDIELSEVPHSLSGKSFAGAGWTGSQVTIDPVNNINFTLLSNRSHNRLTQIAANQRYRLVRENGYSSIILPNGYSMIDSSNYANLRGNIINKCIELAIEYKILEDITGISKDNDYVEETSRVIK